MKIFMDVENRSAEERIKRRIIKTLNVQCCWTLQTVTILIVNVTTLIEL